MTQLYRHYAWQLSYYSGKTRAYLRYKGIAHEEKIIRLWDMRTIRRKVGAQVMPVLLTPEGEWLQDTSTIIDALEQRFPQAPVEPATPRQRVASYLLEAWGDEFWLATAMHYRWNYSENYRRLFRREGGDHLLPFAPRWLKNRVIDKVANNLRGFLPGLGVVSGQIATIERWTTQMLDALDAHFARHAYLLGSKPCHGDFGLIGPLYAHLGRDPYPARELIAPRRHLAAWVQRMQHPDRPQAGEFLADDAIPDTLTPVFASIFGEFWPQLVATEALIAPARAQLKPGRQLPRGLGPIEISLAGTRYRLDARPYSLWMAQRASDAFAALPAAGQQSVQRWLEAQGAGDAFTRLAGTRLRRVGLRVEPE